MYHRLLIIDDAENLTHEQIRAVQSAVQAAERVLFENPNTKNANPAKPSTDGSCWANAAADEDLQKDIDEAKPFGDPLTDALCELQAKMERGPTRLAVSNKELADEVVLLRDQKRALENIVSTREAINEELRDENAMFRKKLDQLNSLYEERAKIIERQGDENESLKKANEGLASHIHRTSGKTIEKLRLLEKENAALMATNNLLRRANVELAKQVVDLEEEDNQGAALAPDAVAPFEIGDCVRLASGGPVMTVEDIERCECGRWHVDVIWFDAFGFHEVDGFDTEVLVAV